MQAGGTGQRGGTVGAATSTSTWAAAVMRRQAARWLAQAPAAVSARRAATYTGDATGSGARLTSRVPSAAACGGGGRAGGERWGAGAARANAGGCVS